MLKTPLRVTSAAVLSLLLAGAATATSTSSSTSGGGAAGTSAGATAATGGSGTASAQRDSQLDRADAGFMKQAAQNGHAEVESSKLALTKATNAQVKSFAQQMVDDHTKANNELQSLAQSKGVELPTDASLAQRAKMKLLSAQDGASFDRRYVQTMGVAAHEDTIKLFEKAANEAKDADVKAFAQKTLPTLQHHLQMARDMRSVVDPESEAKARDDKPTTSTSGTGTTK